MQTATRRKGLPVAVCSLLVCVTGMRSWAEAPAAAPETERLVHRFLEVVVSPDGAFVASVEGDAPRSGNLPTVRDLVIRRVQTEAVTTVRLPCGRAVECWPDSPVWTPDGKHVTFTLRTPGSHARSIYTVGADGSGLVKLIEFSGTIADLSYGPDGHLAMLATENARKEVGATEAGAAITGDLDQPSPEQRIATLESGVLHWASPPDLFVYEYDWLPAGRGFVGTAAHGDGDNNWWIAKLYTFTAPDGSARVIYSPADIRQQLASPRVSRDGLTVAFIGGIMSDFGSTGGDVYTLRLADATTTNITPEMSASARSLAWSCTGRLLANFLAGDQTELVELGDGGRPVTPRVLWSGADSLESKHEGVSFNCPSSVTATVHQNFTTAPEIEVGPIGHWRDLTHVNAGMTLPARVQSLTWSSDGFRVQGWLLLPTHADGKVPLIVVVHGGPAAAAVPAFTGSGIYQTLLEHGYALFRPNPRGSFGQGERFTAANVRDFGQGDLRDIQAGVDAAVLAAPIDGNRVGIMGGSYGGFMTMWAVTQTNRFKAAVAGAGISNWLSYYGENGIDEWMLPYFGKSVYEDPEVYLRLSPINFIRNARTPTFEYVGERDIECPAAQTQEFWHALKALGVPTSVVVYPGEGHRLRDPRHLADNERRTLEWFEKYLR